MKCIKCGAQGCKPYVQCKKQGSDFKVGRAAIGSLLFGATGTALGLTGAKELHVKEQWICPKCGFVF